MKPIVVALLGHANCGKTTLFNALTDSHAAVGNWSGVTVEAKKATAKIGKFSFKFVDLPGFYGLSSPEIHTSIDQQVTQHYLKSGEITCILNILNVTQLERELPLTLELLELGLPVIVVLNMMDMAEKDGLTINREKLSKTLGCPVIFCTALEKQGLAMLQQALVQVLCPLPLIEDPVTQASVPLSAKLSEVATNDPIFSCIQQEETFSHSAYQEKRVQQAETLARTVCQKTVTSKWKGTPLLDKFFLHKIFGLPLLLALMYLAFGFTIYIGGGIQEIFASLLQKILVTLPAAWLQAHQAPEWLICFATQGLGAGIHTTLSFIPVIAVMFLCLSFLETSGYMTRAAMVIDKIMRWIGLSGKSFIPMILGFGCNVPAVLATRTLECRRERILTILMSPFMSCGARLAIYALFVTAFFKEGGHNVIFALYCIGIAMALFTGWVLRNTLLVGNKTQLTLELPPYRFPRITSIIRITVHRTLGFVTKAGMIIVPLSVLLGLIGAFKVGEQTGLVFLGQVLTPFLSPMGIQPENWPATVGLLSGVVAKEVVVGTLNTLYAVNSGGTRTLIDYFTSNASAFSYLLFVLLYFPCVSVLATIAKELNLAWAAFTAIWTTGIAYGVAVLFYQWATFSLHPKSSLMWTILIFGVSLWTWLGLRMVGRHIAGKKPQKPVPTQIVLLYS